MKLSICDIGIFNFHDRQVQKVKISKLSKQNWNSAVIFMKLLIAKVKVNIVHCKWMKGKERNFVSFHLVNGYRRYINEINFWLDVIVFDAFVSSSSLRRSPIFNIGTSWTTESCFRIKRTWERQRSATKLSQNELDWTIWVNSLFILDWLGYWLAHWLKEK